MIAIGINQTLTVDSEDRSGFYLLCNENFEVFMPGTLAAPDVKVGGRVKVCVFIDSKGDEIATSKLPFAEVGDLACLTVQEVTHHGAFLNMGLPKDLLVPPKMQKYEMKVGDVHLVKILFDRERGRIYGTEKIGPYTESSAVPLVSKNVVSIVPFHRTPLGYKILIQQKYLGMIYHNAIFSEIELGQMYEGTVKTVRADGQVDVILGHTGAKGANTHIKIILDALKNAGGELPLSDKSSPEAIKSALGMSKKSFKSAAGSLYKQRRISIESTFIRIVKKETTES